MDVKTDPMADAIEAVGISPNNLDPNLEAANIVDGLYAIARSIDRLAVAVERIGENNATTGARCSKCGEDR